MNNPVWCKQVLAQASRGALRQSYRPCNSSFNSTTTTINHPKPSQSCTNNHNVHQWQQSRQFFGFRKGFGWGKNSVAKRFFGNLFTPKLNELFSKRDKFGHHSTNEDSYGTLSASVGSSFPPSSYDILLLATPYSIDTHETPTTTYLSQLHRQISQNYVIHHEGGTVESYSSISSSYEFHHQSGKPTIPLIHRYPWIADGPTSLSYTSTTHSSQDLPHQPFTSVAPSSKSSSSSTSSSSATSIFDFFEESVSSRPKRALQFQYGISAFAKPNMSDRHHPYARNDDVEATTQTSKSVSASSALPCQGPSDGSFLSGVCGEDSYFTRYDSLGVADGVGAWSQSKVKGADAALYSRKLMHFASRELEKFDDIANNEYDFEEFANVDPKEVLQKSFNYLSKEATEEGLVGSTTASIVILRDDELRICNIGDCGVLIIRDGQLLFRTEEQQHSFNYPYQLGTNSQDKPSDAQSFQVAVQEGDIVIVASDGIFDNLFDEDILKLVNQFVGNRNPLNVDAQQISDLLARRAKEVAEDSRHPNSPFQSRAIQEGLYYSGGKIDDITVAVGIVSTLEDSPNRR